MSTYAEVLVSPPQYVYITQDVDVIIQSDDTTQLPPVAPCQMGPTAIQYLY